MPQFWDPPQIDNAAAAIYPKLKENAVKLDGKLKG
jgi:hypothetical protein